MGRRTNYVSVSVDVDLDDLFDGLDDDILLEELKSRGVKASKAVEGDLRELCEEALVKLQRGDASEAELILTRALFPAFNTPEAVLKRLDEVRKGK